MAYNFRILDREQMYLMPPSLREWLPEDDLAWLVMDAVRQMDLKKFHSRYREDGRGNAAYDPSMMVSLLLYSYCMGERSSRRIERLCERDVAYRVIAANQVPDHTTVARFRQAYEQELGELFTQVLKLCAEAGLVKVGLVALDGTKLKANAALAANRTHTSIEEEVQKWLKEAQATDEEEDRLHGPDRRGDELPPELADRRSRLARLKECKERLEREAAQAAARQQAKIEAAQAEEAATGKKRRGRKPNPPDPTPEADARANVTDPDSRIMKTRSGYVQGYNAQAVVTEDQIVVAAEVTQEENDVHQLHAMLAKAKENLEVAGCREELEAAVADAGYWSEANIREADSHGPELLIATTKDWKQRKALRDTPPPRGRIPANLPPRELMERKLLTKRGRALYKKRSQTVEPVFGQIKETRGCDRFLRRGKSACDSEWKLICTTHNLLKLWRRAVMNVKESGRRTLRGMVREACWA
jgi:transposase